MNRISYIICIITISVLMFGCAKGSITKGNPPKSDAYDDVICGGDGCYIVTKRIDSFDGSYDMLGVVDEKGNFIQSMSSTHPFISNGQIIRNQKSVVALDLTGDDESNEDEMRLRDIRNCMHYLGNHVFAVHYGTNGNSQKSFILYNAMTGKSCDAGICVDSTTSGSNDNPYLADNCQCIANYYNGYLTIRADGNVRIIDGDLNIYETGVSYRGGKTGKFSEDVFFCGNCFYDINGKIVIDMSQYDVNNFQNEPFFENEKSYIELDNGNGVIYHTEIDKNGEFLYEPVK